MKLLFREISKSSAPPPGAGELYIHLGSPELQHRRDLATLVVQQGLACLRQGAGPIEAIVVRADPTLTIFWPRPLPASCWPVGPCRKPPTRLPDTRPWCEKD